MLVQYGAELFGRGPEHVDALGAQPGQGGHVGGGDAPITDQGPNRQGVLFGQTAQSRVRSDCL